MANTRLEKENTQLVDSLTYMHNTEKGMYVIQLKNCSDQIQELQYEVKLANAERDAADRRANAVQSTAEKIRENTSITIENKSKQDTVLIDKK